MEYFPQNALDDDPESHKFRTSWYVPHLLSMKEEPLHPLVVDRPTVYRLLFLPTFDRPSVVRLFEAEGVWRAVCKRSDGRGGYGPGPLVSEEERAVASRSRGTRQPAGWGSILGHAVVREVGGVRRVASRSGGSV